MRDFANDKELVAALRARGEAAAAQAVAAAAKPTRTAWALNQVARARPELVEALLQADSEDDFTASVRAFDRVLISGDYAIPLFYLPKVWVAHWSHLRYPATQPLGGWDLDTWWWDGGR